MKEFIIRRVQESMRVKEETLKKNFNVFMLMIQDVANALKRKNKIIFF
jgi:hypothetical protein